MEILCLPNFKVEVDRLKKNNSYRGIESEIIEEFFDKNILDFKKGSRLNASDDCPYIKGRIGGRSGYRIYYMLIIEKDILYLMYIHPKKGAFGAENITDDFMKELLKDVATASEKNQFLSVNHSADRKKLVYKIDVKNSEIASGDDDIEEN